jgi:cyclopropane fatty-acyl-phospholipid synthase-like methyltransferase
MSDDPKHERFQAAYEGKPPWDLGRPRKPFIDHADQITGAVLDTGCGTGDNALFFAERGQPVLGIDLVAKPIESARRKAEERGIQAEFLQMDALRLQDLDRTFDSVIDCGLFHVLPDEDRPPYVEGLAHVTKFGGRVFLMCFSDEQPGDVGPRRIPQSELREAFSEGWTIESITATRFEPNPNAEERHFGDEGPKAWFAIIRREE